ncbi:MAG: translation initiation factor IF-2 N-terminal domain-containing protein, partial [Deltaproteobacteria bacterium]|nr:translation initiation factor IF-2 N-terminal domain-containing protein [Deltaproteobacteria bacterium]
MPDKKKEQEKHVPASSKQGTDKKHVPAGIKQGIEEKRVKPTVIRRRAAEPTEAEKKESAKKAEEEIKEAAKKPVKGKKAVKHAPAEPAPAVISRGIKQGEEKAAKKIGARAKNKEELPAAIAKKEEKAAPAVKTEAIPSAESKPTYAALPQPEVSATIPAEKIPEEKHVKKEIKIVAAERPAKKKQFERRGPSGKKGKFERLEKYNKIRPPSSDRELKKTEITVPKAAKRVIKIADAISVGDLSQRLGVKAGDIIKKLMDLGVMVTINQFVDVDTATLVTSDFGYEVESIAPQEELLMEDITETQGELKIRPPVVTVMGH